MNLNETAKKCFENAVKRHANGGNVSVDTFHMLKHCATETVEACAAHERWDTVAQYTNDQQTLREYKLDFEREVADILCCALIICGAESLDAERIIAECMEKNRLRAEGIGDKL